MGSMARTYIHTLRTDEEVLTDAVHSCMVLQSFFRSADLTSDEIRERIETMIESLKLVRSDCQWMREDVENIVREVGL